MKLFTYLLIISIFFVSGLSAQIDIEKWGELSFRNLGPAGMSGRVTAIDVNLSDSDHIIVGTASGGVWESKNGGTNWTPIFDEQPVLSIGSIKINQNNSDEIWVGTGEGNPRNSVNTGKGIYKTIDGGKTWKLMGLEETKVIHRIIIHRDNPDIVYAAAMGSPWGPNEERGVFKTTDGGETWEKILYVNELTGAADMVVDPTNPNKILVSMYEHYRKPWTFTSGGEGSGLYLTYDGGKNWKEITEKEGLPKGELGRIGLAIAPSMPNIVYALVEAKENGLYKSTDGGEKWAKVADKNIGNRPFYYAEIYVDPLNENRIYNLWSYVSKSEDGGKTFETIMDYGNRIHPDHHAFWIHPEDPTYLINGNDGGLNISRDRGESWTFINNLPVGQFYHVNYDMDFPYNVYGGMQDNGSWVGPSMVLKSGGIRNYDFQELYFGDGFDVVPFPSDSRYGWAMSQGGNIGFYDRETGAVKAVKPIQEGDEKLRFNWNAPIAQSPFEDCSVYFGSQFVHHTQDCGESWDIISPDLTTNDTSKQKQHLSGGLTIDATQAENYTTLLSIAPSPLDEKVIWTGSDDGKLHISKDGGETWQDLKYALKGVPSGQWIPQIHPSNHNAGEAFIVLNNYRKNDYAPYVLHTKDYGKTFTRIVDEKDVSSFVLTIVQDPKEPSLLFLGADSGLYISFDYGQKWQQLKEDFPSVQVSDLKVHPREDDLIISTFGRALWILDDIRPLREIAKSKNEVLNDSLHLFSSPVAYLTERRSYDGIRFSAQGEFIGDNKSIGAAKINLWTISDKEEKEKVKIVVKNEEGDTIRNFSRKVDAGYHPIYWGLRENGVHYPSKTKHNKENDPPRGIEVLPGTYKIIVSKKDNYDSVMVNVQLDPRLETGILGIKKQYAAQKNYEKVVEKASKAYSQLHGMENSISAIERLLKLESDSIKTEYDSIIKNLKVEIDSLQEIYTPQKEMKGINHTGNTLNNKLYTGSRYLSNSWGEPGANAKAAVKVATEEVNEVVKAIEEFINTQWKTFETKVNSRQWKILPDIDEE